MDTVCKPEHRCCQQNTAGATSTLQYKYGSSQQNNAGAGAGAGQRKEKHTTTSTVQYSASMGPVDATSTVSGCILNG